MKKYLHLIATLLLLLLQIGHVNAQRIRRAPTLTLGAQVAQPLGQFGQVYDGYPVGLAGSFVAPVSNSPIEFGIAVAWNNMGSQDENVTAYIGADAAGDSIYEQGTMRIRSNNHRFQMIGRFRPFNGLIQPYVDGVAGLETFKTKTDITLNSSGYSEANNSVRQQFDMTYSYGWGAGIRVRIAPNIFVDGRFEHLQGGPAQYVDQESITVIDENTIEFETLKSRTDRYTYQLSLTIGF